jgi:hypothetical protein
MKKIRIMLACFLLPNIVWATDILGLGESPPPALIGNSGAREVGACKNVTASSYLNSTLVAVRERTGSVCAGEIMWIWLNGICNGGWKKETVYDFVSVDPDTLKKLDETGHGSVKTVKSNVYGVEMDTPVYTPIKSVNDHQAFIAQKLGLKNLAPLFAGYSYAGYTFSLASTYFIFDVDNPPIPDDRSITINSACPIGTYIGQMQGNGSNASYTCCAPSK